MDIHLNSEQLRGGSDELREVNDLVRRCAHGDAAAWSELFERYHARLQARIRMFLRHQGHDCNLVDEIAAQVWLVLLQRDGRLLRQYQPNRSFLAYLASIARYEALVRFRTDRRRRNRETADRVPSANGCAVFPEFSGLEYGEFLATLSPSERKYLETELVPRNGHRMENLSRANHWQLRHRIRRKLREYLGQSAP